MKSKTNFKLLIALTSTIALVACNGGGGGGGGGDTPPGPGPSPTPPAPGTLQALQFQSVGTPLNLNKVGGSGVWYMLAKNPNSNTVNVFSRDNNTYEIFLERGIFSYNTGIIHPMQFVETYSGEVSGYSSTPDCLSLVNRGELVLGANQSCIYKFKAFWNSNLNMPNTTQFQIDYAFYAPSISTTQLYCTSDIATGCNKTIGYDSNNTLSYQSYTVKSQDNIESQLGFSNFNFSFTGNKVLNWVQYPTDSTMTQTINTYNVNYNSSANQLSLSGQQVFNGFNTSHGTYNFNYNISGFISSDGSNFGSNSWNNMTFLGANVMEAISGTNGTVYVTNLNLNVYKSATGDFINSQNYSQVVNPWSVASYGLIGVDETTNVALLYKPSTGQNFCFNINNGTYTQLSVLTGGQYGFQLFMGLNNTLPVINGGLYLSTGHIYGKGQNGQNYWAKTANYSTMRKINTTNCSVGNTDQLYSFVDISANTTGGYSGIATNSDLNQYLVSNANFN